jgi:hypothetical protein
VPVNRVPKKVPSKVAVFAEPFGIYSDDAQPINVDVTRIKMSPIKYFMIISRQSGCNPPDFVAYFNIFESDAKSIGFNSPRLAAGRFVKTNTIYTSKQCQLAMDFSIAGLVFDKLNFTQTYG